VVPLFFLDHILLWRQGLNISWPSIPGIVANILSLVTIITGFYLLGNRIFHQDTRSISKPIDFLLLILILCIFITGLIASKPVNPMPYKTTMFIHIMCGNFLFILIPFTKLAHCLLFPFIRIASNIAWRFPARAGEEINKTLYDEEIRKI
jgi:nitrate reductase gamma subunit